MASNKCASSSNLSVLNCTTETSQLNAAMGFGRGRGRGKARERGKGRGQGRGHRQRAVLRLAETCGNVLMQFLIAQWAFGYLGAPFIQKVTTIAKGDHRDDQCALGAKMIWLG